MKFSQWLDIYLIVTVDIYLTVTWYLPHSDLIFTSQWLFIFTSQWLDIYLTVTWYLPHSDLIFTSQWLDIYLKVTWYLPHSNLILTSQWLDIYFTVTVDIYPSIGWFFFRVYLHSQSFYVKSVIYLYMLHSLFLNMVLISDCWFGRRNFTTERRFDPGKNRS